MAGIIVPIICFAIVISVLGMAGFAVWRLRRDRGKAARPPYPVIDATEAEMDRRRSELRDGLSHRVLGAERAQRLWDGLQRAKIGDGLIHQFHRDFCGHGLIRTQNGVILCDILDGSYPGNPIATWATKAEFVTLLARQSDFTMSGWDPAEPVFFTEDAWYRDNQRLTAEIIDRFTDGKNG